MCAAVEYRLLPNSPFPAALQDAASVYAQLIRSGVPSHKIVLIGDSAGGNIVLALARWIRDEKKTAPPGGLLLLSVSPANRHFTGSYQGKLTTTF